MMVFYYFSDGFLVLSWWFFITFLSDVYYFLTEFYYFSEWLLLLVCWIFKTFLVDVYYFSDGFLLLFWRMFTFFWWIFTICLMDVYYLFDWFLPLFCRVFTTIRKDLFSPFSPPPSSFFLRGSLQGMLSPFSPPSSVNPSCEEPYERPFGHSTFSIGRMLYSYAAYDHCAWARCVYPLKHYISKFPYKL